MGGNASQCVNPQQGQTAGSDDDPDKSGSRRLRVGKRSGVKGSGNFQRQLKEEQFSGIAKVQITSVSPHHVLSDLLSMRILSHLPECYQLCRRSDWCCLNMHFHRRFSPDNTDFGSFGGRSR